MVETPAPADGAGSRLVAFFRSGETLRSRSVGSTVRAGTLGLPTPPARVVADWEREARLHLCLEPGDVEPLPLARTQARWPALRQCVQAAADWTRGQGMGEVLEDSEMALMACLRTAYHHDAGQYGGAAFCNLFLGDDSGTELHFASLGLRIPLRRGTVVVFDTGQPHAVVRRVPLGAPPASAEPTDVANVADAAEAAGSTAAADASATASAADPLQVFLTWELPIEHAAVARALGVTLDIEASTAATLQDEQLRQQGARVEVCPDSGAWRAVP